jgi:hypothetical protein
MKKSILIFSILALALFSVSALAQNGTRASIPGNGWYWNTLKAVNSGTAGGTLFDNAVSTAETSQTIYPSGFILASLKYSVADTCRDTIYVDYSVDDGTTWSVIATKAMNCTDYLTPTVYEEVLRDGDSDLIDGVVGRIRVRNNRAATANGTAGSYPTITVKFNWHP